MKDYERLEARVIGYQKILQDVIEGKFIIQRGKAPSKESKS